MSDIVAKLLSTLDLLQMELAAVDDVGPYIKDCFIALKRYPSPPEEFQNKQLAQVEAWYAKISSMNASDVLTKEQLRQLKYEIQDCFDTFNLIIQQK